MYIGLIAAALAMIFSPLSINGSSWPNSRNVSAWLPPRHMLQSRYTNAAKFNTTILDLACPDPEFDVCILSNYLRDLDEAASHSSRYILSLGSSLGTLLYSTKMAASKGECSYLPQLRLKVQAGNENLEIQESLNTTLISSGKTLSLFSESRSKAEGILAVADKGSDGHFQRCSTGDRRKEVYRTKEKWLNIFKDYMQQVGSREDLLRWELERQKRLGKDLEELEKEIERLGIDCMVSDVRQIERRLLEIMVKAAEDEVAVETLRKYQASL